MPKIAYMPKLDREAQGSTAHPVIEPPIMLAKID